MGDLVTSFAEFDAGGCPSPFAAEDLYPFKGGWKGSRLCQTNILSSNTNASRCCLPCPVVDYLYPDSFDPLADGTAWVHVGAFILCSFLLISMIVLPHESRRAYLNLVLVVGILIFDLGFIIPLARSPPKCFDKITQASQNDSFTCAISGAFVSFGALFLIEWVLVRALFMHLQICWSVVPGTKSYIAANIAVFAICIALETATLAHNGVSMKWGHYCHVNIGSNATYWGWMISFAGLSFLLQLATFGYVMKVYISSAISGDKKMNTSSMSGPFVGSSRSRNARATARRVRKALLLQWRSLLIVTVAIFTVLFACLVFVVNNGKFTEQALANSSEVLLPWIVCLVTTQDKNQCLPFINNLILSEGLLIAALFVMAFAGIWAFVLLFRFEIFSGWWNLLRRRSRRGSDSSFVDRMTRKNTTQNTTQNTTLDDKVTSPVSQISPILPEVEKEVSRTARREPLRDEELGPLQMNPVSPLEPHAK